jgi:hypothetical protein
MALPMNTNSAKKITEAMVRRFSALEFAAHCVLLPYFGSEMEARCVWQIIDRPWVAHRESGAPTPKSPSRGKRSQ